MQTVAPRELPSCPHPASWMTPPHPTPLLRSRTVLPPPPAALVLVDGVHLCDGVQPRPLEGRGCESVSPLVPDATAADAHALPLLLPDRRQHHQTVPEERHRCNEMARHQKPGGPGVWSVLLCQW